LTLHPHLKVFLRSLLLALEGWAGELSYRMATNHCVCYCSLILAARLIAGALGQMDEAL
jgi:hypothetical protein